MNQPSEQIDHKDVRRLLLEVDEEGTRLTRKQIDFVADLIDRKVRKFTAKQAAKVRALHHKKVINGKPDPEL